MNWSKAIYHIDRFILFEQLRSYMTEILLDQIPVLGNMQRYLENLSIMDPPPVKQDLILEQVSTL